MAKKPNGGGKKPPVAESTTKLVSAPTLKNLMKSARSLKESTDDLTTAYASEVREAVDKKHLHKKAYNTIRMLDRMTPEKLADFMEHFDHMFEVSGLEQRAESAQRLPMGDGPGEKDEEDGQTDKVKKLAEEAGASTH